MSEGVIFSPTGPREPHRIWVMDVSDSVLITSGIFAALYGGLIGSPHVPRHVAMNVAAAGCGVVALHAVLMEKVGAVVLAGVGCATIAFLAQRCQRHHDHESS